MIFTYVLYKYNCGLTMLSYFVYFQRYKLQKDDELELLYLRETELEAELLIMKDKGFPIPNDDEIANKIESLTHEKTLQKFIYTKEIAELQNKLELYRDNINTNEERTTLIDKGTEIEYLKNKIKELEDDVELEQEQRHNSTLLLAEMSKDMRKLLNTIKDFI